MRHLVSALAVLVIALAAVAAAEDADREAIAQTIDGFHAAAARGDKEGYLAYLTDDAVFLGTDEWERWPKQPAFTDYVAGRFKDGSGWEYRSVERNLRLAEGGNVAWFDEVVESAVNGRFRGTGVVVKVGSQWKIAHYAMSFLVFNEDWPTVIELTKKTREMKSKDRAAK